jgi:hypothetical protein
MRKSFLYLSIFVFLGLSLKGQGDYTHEVGMVSDNDAYLMLAIDQYYTNGLMLDFRFVPRNFKENLYNRIIEFRIGQKIYNPFQGYVPWEERVDRPFAGYLFAEAGISRYYHDESMLKTVLQIGILGPSSHAEDVQRFYHRALNLYGIDGWQYQIRDAAGINLEIAYLKMIKSFFGRKLDVSLHSGFRAGTINDDISAGVLTRASIYKLQPVYNSSCTGSAISRNKDIRNDKELFIYFNPRLSYVLYDATVQGSMFSDTSPITFGIKPVKLCLELGLSGYYKHLGAGYAVTFVTKDAKNNLEKNHIFASISFAYRY